MEPPITEQLSDRLADRLGSGKSAPGGCGRGERLPTEQRRLAQAHGVSRTAVREAVTS